MADTQATQEPLVRRLIYALTSVALGAWTFKAVNGVSGPAFEPILEACPPNSFQSMDEFVEQSGYHAYDPYVGLGAFDTLVCLITQFLLELRQTYPAGVLVWSAIIVVSLPITVVTLGEAGRKGAKGFIRYPVALGLLGQLFGISVVFPLIWFPALVYGEGIRGSPLTAFRIKMGGFLSLPSSILTVLVFAADTDSQLWMRAAGMLGGPILAMGGLVCSSDKSHLLEGTDAEKESTKKTLDSVLQTIFVLGLIGWYALVKIAYDAYGFSVQALWEDIWVNAGPSVAFMTIDSGVLFLSFLQYIAYRGGEMKAVKALGLTTILGPAAACCIVLREIGESGTEKKKVE